MLLSFYYTGAFLALLVATAEAEIPEDNRMHIGNMTCDMYEQPLNHFHVPKEKSPTYYQRYCTYNKYVKDPANAPIFFYTGNESPLEQYINNTGLMWELAPEFGAEIIFMEHRYEGKSLPSPSIPNCMSYSSSKQAIEDYARFLEYWMLNSTISANDGVDNGSIHKRPVIAFGGSYGGMLTAWFRMKYPQLVTGGIAASAPIWSLPRTNADLIDGAYQVVKRGLQLPYPPTEKQQDNSTPNHCVTNLRAAWPLMQYLATANETTNQKLNKKDKPDETPPGLAKLTEWFRLCEPLKQVQELVEWASTPWFDMAEGSFPYASSYVPFALIKSNGTILKLPPWPLQAACWNQSQLYKDWGVQVDGNFTDVKYTLTYGDSGLSLDVDWESAALAGNVSLEQVLNSSQVEGLMTSVRDAVAVWYNITEKEPCFNLTPANNLKAGLKTSHKMRSRAPHGDEKGADSKDEVAFVAEAKVRRLKGKDNHNATALCEAQIAGGSWPPLNCNEEMNTMIVEARGMGRDIFWPPQYDRGTTNHGEVARQDADRSNTTVPGFCLDPLAIYGYSQLPVDPWSTRLDTYYGGRDIGSFSNIVFSNGLLDPWMAGGVHNLSVTELNPEDPLETPTYDGATVIPVGNEKQDMIALIIEHGGHHTDLMYSSDKDPDCVKKAREIEKKYIKKWIAQIPTNN